MLPLLKTAGAGGRVPFGWLPALQSAELMTAFWQQYAGEDSQSSRSGKVKQEVPNGPLLNRQCLLSSRLKVQKIPLSKAIKISKPMHFFYFFYLKTLQQTSRLRILARPPWFICCIQFFLCGPNASSEIRNMHENLYSIFSLSSVCRWGLSKAAGCAWIIVIWQAPSILPWNQLGLGLRSVSVT